MTIGAATIGLLGRFALSWLAIVAVSFVLLRVMPGDPIDLFLVQVGTQASPEVVAAYRTQWGLDEPMTTQFGRWLVGFLTLDWGVSYQTGRPVVADFAGRLPYSAAIGFGGMATAIVGGFALGFLATHRPGGVADALSRGLAVAGQAMPAFAVGLALLWVLGVQLRWIDVFGGGLVERLALPILLVALFSVGSMARLARAGLMAVKLSPYYRTALAKGRSPALALWLHGRGAGALTVLAGLAPELAWIVGGTAVVEIVFGVPGVSERIVDAVAARDYAVLQPYIALVALWVMGVLSAAALLQRTIDPRIAP